MLFKFLSCLICVFLHGCSEPFKSQTNDNDSSGGRNDCFGPELEESRTACKMIAECLGLSIEDQILAINRATCLQASVATTNLKNKAGVSESLTEQILKDLEGIIEKSEIDMQSFEPRDGDDAPAAIDSWRDLEPKLQRYVFDGTITNLKDSVTTHLSNTVYTTDRNNAIPKLLDIVELHGEYKIAEVGDVKVLQNDCVELKTKECEQLFGEFQNVYRFGLPKDVVRAHNKMRAMSLLELGIEYLAVSKWESLYKYGKNVFDVMEPVHNEGSWTYLPWVVPKACELLGELQADGRENPDVSKKRFLQGKCLQELNDLEGKLAEAKTCMNLFEKVKVVSDEMRDKLTEDIEQKCKDIERESPGQTFDNQLLAFWTDRIFPDLHVGGMDYYINVIPIDLKDVFTLLGGLTRVETSPKVKAVCHKEGNNNECLDALIMSIQSKAKQLIKDTSQELTSGVTHSWCAILLLPSFAIVTVLYRWRGVSLSSRGNVGVACELQP